MAHSEIVELILTRSAIGDGTQGNPHRMITEYFEKDGRLLFRIDEWEQSHDETLLKTPAQEASTDVVS